MANMRPALRRLIVFRHAKAERGATEGADFGRPLAPRGRRDAAGIGRALAALGPAPDLVLCSAATRAKETWALAGGAFEPRPKVLMRRDLYLADAGAVLAVIKEAGGHAATLVVVGHNPGLQDLLLELIGSSDPAARRKIADKFPTAAAAVVAFEPGPWSALRRASGRLVRLLTPGSLADGAGPEGAPEDTPEDT
ncbi:MAG: histidine phosphatase family protein [Alphaproteobacteria bacterium]